MYTNAGPNLKVGIVSVVNPISFSFLSFFLPDVTRSIYRTVEEMGVKGCVNVRHEFHAPGGGIKSLFSCLLVVLRGLNSVDVFICAEL